MWRVLAPVFAVALALRAAWAPVAVSVEARAEMPALAFLFAAARAVARRRDGGGRGSVLLLREGSSFVRRHGLPAGGRLALPRACLGLEPPGIFDVPPRPGHPHLFRYRMCAGRESAAEGEGR